MRKITLIKTLILVCSALIDKGVTISIEEIEKHFEGKDLIDWLAKRFPFGSEPSTDFSLLTKDHRDFVHECYHKY